MIWLELAFTMIGHGDCLIEWNMSCRNLWYRVCKTFGQCPSLISMRDEIWCKVDWSDGRRIEVEYDRRDRVISMSDTNQRRLEFVWGRDGHHRMFDSAGKVLNWVVSEGQCCSHGFFGNDSNDDG